MKYFAYDDPSENGNVQTVRSIRKIVHDRVVLAETIQSGYPSAQDALLDHIAVNWAYECRKDGSRIPGVK